MDFRIVEKESFKVIGKGKRVPKEDRQIIPAFWEECIKSGFEKKLWDMAGKMGQLGICSDFDYVANEFTYFIGIEKPDGNIPEGFEEQEIPASKYVVFPAKGVLPDTMQSLWVKIFDEWFPESKYESTGGPEIEAYFQDKNTLSEDNRFPESSFEVWIPIKEK